MSWPISVASAITIALMAWKIEHGDMDGAAANGMGFALGALLCPLWDWLGKRLWP